MFKSKKISVKRQWETKLFFDPQLENSITIELKPKYTCQDITKYFHNLIVDFLIKTYPQQILNSSVFSFVVIDPNFPYNWLKLRDFDCPFKYLSRNPAASLIYMNCSKDSMKRPRPTAHSTIKLDKDIIREGDLSKFSYRLNRFDRRHITLDKEKLVLKKLKEDEYEVLLFSEVDTITTEISDRRILQICPTKYLFEIRTKDSEKIYLASKSINDLEGWVEAVSAVFIINRDNAKINSLEISVNQEMTDLFKNELKLMNCFVLIYGVFAVDYLKRLLVKHCAGSYNEILEIINTIQLYKLLVTRVTNALISSYTIKNMDLTKEELDVLNSDLNDNCNELISTFYQLYTLAEYPQMHSYYEDLKAQTRMVRKQTNSFFTRKFTNSDYRRKSSNSSDENFLVSRVILKEHEQGGSYDKSSDLPSKSFLVNSQETKQSYLHGIERIDEEIPMKKTNSNYNDINRQTARRFPELKSKVRVSSRHVNSVYNCKSLIDAARQSNKTVNKTVTIFKVDLFDELYAKLLLTHFTDEFKGMFYNLKHQFRKRLEYFLLYLFQMTWTRKVQRNWYLQLDSFYRIGESNMYIDM